MDFLTQQNKRIAGDDEKDGCPGGTITARQACHRDRRRRHGVDCIGTSLRQGAASVTQLEIMPEPPVRENKALTWPHWPLKLRTSSSHEEGCERDFSVLTQRFIGENGKVTALDCARARWSWHDGRMNIQAVPGSEFELKADLVLLAMGFTGPRIDALIDQAGVALDPRGNVKAHQGRLPDLGSAHLRLRRHAAWPVAGRLGDPRRPRLRRFGRPLSVGSPAPVQRRAGDRLAHGRIGPGSPMCGIAGWYRRGGKPVRQEAYRPAVRRHRPPRAGRRRLSARRRFRLRHAPPQHHRRRRRPPADRQRGRPLRDRRQRRNRTTIPTFAASSTGTIASAPTATSRRCWPAICAGATRPGCASKGCTPPPSGTAQTQTLTLARDPLGIKPLYLTEQHGGLAFASEITRAAPLPGHRFDVDDRGVHDFFSFGHVLGPRSIFRQVRSLPPGHVLRVGPDGDARTHCFWQARLPGARAAFPKRNGSRRPATRVLQTVGQHMLSDVPVGAFLSGGVDSARSPRPWRAFRRAGFKVFTVGFPGSKIDETEAARRIADHLGCEHIVLPLEPGPPREILPAVQRAFDEPSAANSAIPFGTCPGPAAEHVKVVLCGEGGDELFMGYKRQRTAQASALGPAPSARSADWASSTASRAVSRRLNYLRQNGSSGSAIRPCSTAASSNFSRQYQITSPALRRALRPRFLAAAGRARTRCGTWRRIFPPSPSPSSRRSNNSCWPT